MRVIKTLFLALVVLLSTNSVSAFTLDYPTLEPTEVDKGGKRLKDKGQDKKKKKTVTKAHKRAINSRKMAKTNEKWKRKDMAYRARTRLMFHKWFNTKPGKRVNYRKAKHNRSKKQH